MSEWKKLEIEADGSAYAKEVLISEDDPEIRISGSRKHGEGFRTGSIWISKKQIEEINNKIQSSNNSRKVE